MWSQFSAGLENVSRKVWTAARVSGAVRFLRSPPGWFRAISSSVTTAFGVTLTASGSVPAPAAVSRATRSATISAKRGSEVYWAIPTPLVNGSDPRSRSHGRQPSVVVSRVTTSAPAPAASAREMKLSTSCSSLLQYSWNQRGPSFIAAAVASIGDEPWEDRMYGSPRSAAARPMWTSASRRTRPAAPIGATRTGAGSVCPSTCVDRSRWSVLRRTRGTSRRRSSASRLALIVTPEPAPP